MMKNNFNIITLTLAILLLIISACQKNAEETVSQTVINKFDDAVVASIYEAQDRRDTKTLLGFLNHENAKYREEAAMAFGSVQDSAAISYLSLLLDDKNAKVRKAAAYALGQSSDSSVVVPLTQALVEEDTLVVRKEMIEALGKVIPMTQLITLQNMLSTDDLVKEGVSWGLYRAAVRNVYDQLSVDMAIGFLYETNSYETRLGAAHFLSRTRELNLKGKEQAIIETALYDPSEYVRMACALALKNAPGQPSLEALSENLVLDPDYRVRINALRALAVYDYNQISDVLKNSLIDENINVAITAADVLTNTATKEDVDTIIEIALNTENTRVQSTLLGAALTLSDDKNDMIEKIKGLYEQSENPYYKAGLLTALGESPLSYEFVITKTFSEDNLAVSTAGISALVAMRSMEDFPSVLKNAFADVFKQAMETGDVAMVAIVSQLLMNPAYGFKSNYKDFEFLKVAKSKLSLPKDNEALQVLNKTIAYFEGKEELPETKNEYNNPIDWELVKSLDRDQNVIIKTDRGEVILRMLVEKAPGSVANFIKLSKSGYFNGKNFHRVVPNFVVQGGCNRGDGYGGENYSLRSEFDNIRYQEGSVGMASAGKDTEGTQWFITHSPTPHLDGRYTIFAQVTSGMDVVHNIEVGDKIISVELAE